MTRKECLTILGAGMAGVGAMLLAGCGPKEGSGEKDDTDKDQETPTRDPSQQGGGDEGGGGDI